MFPCTRKQRVAENVLLPASIMALWVTLVLTTVVSTVAAQSEYLG